MTTQANPYSNAGRWRAAAASLTLLLLLGCSSSPRQQRAPVEDRVNAGRAPAAAPAMPAAAPVTPVAPGAPAAPGTATAVAPDAAAKVLPGAENAGKPGYYTVKPGDTLIRIGLETGQNWRDIQRWNELENPNLIEVGQVVRVVPPAADANGVVTRPVAAAGRVEARPLPTGPGTPGTAGTAGTASAPAAGGATPTPAAASGGAPAASPAAPAAATASTRDPDELNWAWPATGPVLTNFDETKNKGVALAGKAGDPVLASADGRVVYAGSGLRGYGNLIIVKHNATFLSAYAHNQLLLVKEDQVVRRGQKIAEMGSSDAERVQLHFEIRRQGKPVDPAKLLPPR